MKTSHPAPNKANLSASTQVHRRPAQLRVIRLLQIKQRRLTLLLAALIIGSCFAVANPSYAQTATIAANQSWQSTGFTATAGQTLRIQVTSGTWTHWLGTVPFNPGIGTSPCGNSGCVEPFPSAPNGSLIARIGSNLYPVGQQNEITVLQSGVVELRINDADNGLFDNSGSLEVSITTVIPGSFAVESTQGWQRGPLVVYAGQTVRIEVADGTWTHWQGTVTPNPGVGMPPCSNSSCVEPLPSAPIGSLIARIGSKLYPVGSGNEFVVQETGRLELRINDADQGLFDNNGTLSVTAEITAQPPPKFVKKVAVLVYNPIFSSGKTMVEERGWQNHVDLTAQTIDLFYRASGGQLQYQVVETITRNTWPVLSDGYQYTEATWTAAMNTGIAPSNAMVDYAAIVNDPLLDYCGKRNRDEIDEVWVYNGPYFGFYESLLVGPNAYRYNSPPLTTNNTCQKLLPIMGPNPEREAGSAVHNFGHRFESTMVRLYGPWVQNRTANPWERFALNDTQAPGYSYAGCGNTHFPPNGRSDYDYVNTAPVLSNCDSFWAYPNTPDPPTETRLIDCSEWGCSEMGYYEYWYSHFPSATGCTNGYLNNWWYYFANPIMATQAPHPVSVCSPSNEPAPYTVALPLLMR